MTDSTLGGVKWAEAMQTVDAELRSLLMHDRFVRRIARGLVSDPSAVDDVVQETWWAAIRRRPASDRPVLPWLAKVARHLSLNRRRADARRDARERIAAVPESLPSTAALIEREAVRRSVVQSVLDLDEPLRTTVVLRYFEGLSTREIARRTGVPVETARSRLKRALALLRAKLAPLDSERRSSFGAALLSLAHGPNPSLIVSAATSGKAILGALAMSTGTKAAAAVAALLLVVGLVFVPPYLARSDREGPRAPADSPASDSSRSIARGDPAPIQARPYSESEPSSATPGPAALEIELVGPGGAPAPRARLLLHRGKELLGQATTNADGRADLPPGEGEAGLIAVPDGAPVHFATIALAPGRRRVQLPSGLSISGRVELNGNPPPEPIKLTMQPTVREPQLSDFWDALKGALSATCTSTASGDFQFAGLREGSEWRIGPTLGSTDFPFGATSGYRVDEIIRDGRPVIALSPPANGLVVRLRRMPVVRGRVVSGEPRVPVAGVGIAITTTAAGQGRQIGLSTQDDGTFRFAVEDWFERDWKVSRIIVEIFGPKGIGRREIVLDPPPDRDHDLGDLELPAGRTVRFVVKDSAGTPVEGAFARVRHVADPESRTDSEGRGAIVVSTEARSFLVGALKHEIVEIAIPSPLPDLLPIVLKPNGGLEVRLRVEPAAAAAFMMIRITADARDIVGTNALGNDAIYVSSGATPNGPGSYLSNQHASFVFVPIDGRVVVAGLKPGIPLTVRARDPLWNTLADAVVTLGPSEWRAVELRAQKPARSLRGRVFDPSRRPVSDCRVTINAPPAEPEPPDLSIVPELNATTDAEGRFAFGGLVEQQAVHLAVYKPGLARLIRRDLVVPANDAEIELVLQKGCEVVAKIVDAHGAPIRRIESVWAGAPGYPTLTATERQPGEYVFADFPLDVTATITVGWADREWTRTIAVKGDHAVRFDMPATGTLLVDLTAVVDPGVEHPFFDLRLERTGDDPFTSNPWIPPPPPGAPATHEVSPILPGDYTAVLSFGSRGRDSQSVSRSVRITASETTRVVFQKP